MTHSLQGNPNSDNKAETLFGEVVKLDRKFPLIATNDGYEIRCEHGATLKKTSDMRAVIGDIVRLRIPEQHDLGIIEEILPRKTEFVRNDPVDRTRPQTLAANFDRVIIVHPINRLNLSRLERELVLAHETGASVIISLTKADMCPTAMHRKEREVRKLAKNADDVCVTSINDISSIERLRETLGDGTTSILIGSSGAGKSTLVNFLFGEDVCEISDVREGDGKGRHTTVTREILELPTIKEWRQLYTGSGISTNDDSYANDEIADNTPPTRIIDMPGLRGLALWSGYEGLEVAFPDVNELAAFCRFRDCKHKQEPGCAVRRAVEDGTLTEARYNAYQKLLTELDETTKKRQQSSWKN